MALTFKLFTGWWCPTCKPRGEFIEDLCVKHDLDLEIIRLEDPGTRHEAAKFHIDTIPMVIVLDEAKDILVQFGPNAREDQIIKWLEERMSLDAKSTGSTTTEEGTSDVPRE